MCSASLKNGRSSDELRDRLGIPDITEVLCKNRLRWFGQVMRMDAGNPASACRHAMVEGKREQVGLRKTWLQIISNDLRRMKLYAELAQDCRSWRRAIMTPCSPMLAWKQTQNDYDDDA